MVYLNKIKNTNKIKYTKKYDTKTKIFDCWRAPNCCIISKWRSSLQVTLSFILEKNRWNISRRLYAICWIHSTHCLYLSAFHRFWFICKIGKANNLSFESNEFALNTFICVWHCSPLDIIQFPMETSMPLSLWCEKSFGFFSSLSLSWFVWLWIGWMNSFAAIEHTFPFWIQTFQHAFALNRIEPVLPPQFFLLSDSLCWCFLFFVFLFWFWHRNIRFKWHLWIKRM